MLLGKIMTKRKKNLNFAGKDPHEFRANEMHYRLFGKA